ncbi:hypothetical protein IDH44_07720 [Paenibacillus sp. IB182496]|uniref:Uncharacterized protein n=1 Tax=Paenibacillus sabuli TaxID=2772509 RepID=A0A927BSQ7_9BACL|nr:hypothetical protein [Paenibacillus sabuli]MBD2845075.1 hypothetical protein [Paenibacillus sabuli]
MTKMMKKSFTMLMMLSVLLLAMAASAFAAPADYEFHYGGTYHSHSSAFIDGPADVTGGNVTITLSGNYFPELTVGGVTYTGSYDSGSGLTTFTFPGSTASDIPVSLHVVVAPFHDTWYNLDLVWL